MLWAIIAVTAGIALTVVSADKFVDGAAGLASRLGLSHFLIGLTIMSIGTSAPELLVSIVAAYEGAPGLALGNALGSNIANIALVLGVTACIFPLKIPRRLLWREIPMLIFVCLGVYAFAYRGAFDRITGTTFLLFIPVILLFVFKDRVVSTKQGAIPKTSLGQSIILTMGGLLALIGSSKILVWGAVEIARYIGISELVIGLTIVAIGTSLPELATSTAAALKNQTDLALGTIIGSNFFNFLGVIGLAALISPFPIESDIFSRDLPWTLGLIVLLWILTRFVSNETISRPYGILLLLLYVGYLYHIFLTTVPNP